MGADFADGRGDLRLNSWRVMGTGGIGSDLNFSLLAAAWFSELPEFDACFPLHLCYYDIHGVINQINGSIDRSVLLKLYSRLFLT